MYDFNFFESLSPKSKKHDTSNQSLVRLCIVLVLILAAWPLFNLGYGYKLAKDTEALKIEVLQNQKYPMLEQANALKEYINQRGEQLAALKKADGEVQNSEWLNEAFLFNLLSAAPKDLRYNQLSITPDKGIQIVGSAKNKPAIAELERSLRDSDRFQLLQISTIANNTGSYNFNMNLVLKDVNKDAAN